MSSRWRWSVVALVACGSETLSLPPPATDAGVDGASDATGDVIVVADVSPSDGGGDAKGGDAEKPVVLNMKCAEADECEAGAPVCCATFDFGNDCVLDSVTGACAASSACATTIQPFCAQTETVRLCAGASECTEPSYTKCCTFQITGHTQSIAMCASQQMAEAADASCTN